MFRHLLALAALVCATAAQAQTVPYTFPNVVNPDGVQRGSQPVFPLNLTTPIADGSGTVTTAGTSQQVFAANNARLLLICQNPIGAPGPLYVNLGAAASATGSSIELAAGGTMTLVGVGTPTSSVTVTSGTAGHRFVCKQR